MTPKSIKIRSKSIPGARPRKIIQNDSKNNQNPQKSLQNRCPRPSPEKDRKNDAPDCCPVPSGGLKWIPKSQKMDPKTPSQNHLKIDAEKVRKMLPDGIQNGAKRHPKTMKKRCQNRGAKKMRKSSKKRCF